MLNIRLFLVQKSPLTNTLQVTIKQSARACCWHSGLRGSEVLQKSVAEVTSCPPIPILFVFF